jgi:hypothetical protein
MNHNRRDFFSHLGSGLAGVAFAWLNGGQQAQGAVTHHPAKAKRVIQIFCPGAASHIDLWDWKPELERLSGQPMPGGATEVTFQGKNGNLMRSPWDFVPRGKSGKRISSMLPELGKVVDDIAFIHSMTSRTNTHGPGCVFMNSGFIFEGFPSAGAWVSYALGAANENLPAFVAIPDVRGIPPSGPANWTSGFLPAQHQAVSFSASDPIRNLDRPSNVTAQADEETRSFLRTLNGEHAQRYPGNADLTGRIAAYELAARMQLAAPEAADLSKETRATRNLYGADDTNPLLAAYARNCILARRLIERGVRFVQLYCGSRASAVDGLLNWDAHKTLQADYERHCPILDRPTAGLIQDLRSRGLLNDTLVLWTTEFGRMPTHQADTLGRDHNPDAFTCWMLGAGVKGGVSYGETDPFGRRSVVDVATVHDFYATVLYLLGIDHQRLTWYHNGIQRRLTDVHGHVIRPILA